MAEYTSRLIGSSRYEYVLRSPTNAAEFAKAYAGAETQAKSIGVRTDCDDWLTVEARDDEIVLHFTITSAPQPVHHGARPV